MVRISPQAAGVGPFSHQSNEQRLYREQDHSRYRALNLAQSPVPGSVELQKSRQQYSPGSFEEEADFQTDAFLATIMMAGGVNNSQLETTTSMNYNNGSRPSKIKSGSLPGRYTSSPNSAMSSPSGSSPSAAAAARQHYKSYDYDQHQYPSPNYGFASSSSNNSNPAFPNAHQLPPPMSSTIEPSSKPGKESSKKWNPFGGLFRRKDKSGGHEKLSKNSTTSRPSHTIVSPKQVISSPSAIPIQIQFEANQRPVISSEASDGSLSDSDDDKKKPNFLTRKLSRGKKKKSVSKSPSQQQHQPSTIDGVDSSLLKVPPAPLRYHKNGNSNRKANKNRHSQPILQSWETTKKITNSLGTSSSLNNPNNNNYSSSGSLSLSIEGSSSLSKESKAAAKEATKARAVARRNSYFNEESSSNAEDGDDNGSFQGSHSSLSLRNKKLSRNGNNGLRPAQAHQHLIQSLNNSNSSFPSMMMGLPNLPSTSSPNLIVGNNQYPPSPRWEARVVYTKETLEDDDTPVVVKLPKYYNGDKYMLTTTETISGGDADNDDGVVVTAGFKVPLVMSNTEPIYANLPSNSNSNGKHGSKESPTPPKRDFYRPTIQNFYRPVSCSYLDSYNVRNPKENIFGGRDLVDSQPQSILEYDKEPSRLKSPVADGTGKSQHYYYDDSKLMSPSPSTIGNNSVPVKYPVQPHLQYSNGNGSPEPSPRKLPATSSPVHTNASAFWKQKEQEVIQNRGVSPQQQIFPVVNPHRNLTRIRSADSSPLLLPKNNIGMTKPNVHHRAAAAPSSGPGAPGSLLLGTTPFSNSINSTESISSLSSFTNETTTPSPNMFSTKNSRNNATTPTGKIPSGYQQRNSYRSSNSRNSSNKENVLRAYSACERLGVGRFSPNSGTPPPPTPNNHPHDAENNNNRSNIKSPGRNLEDALNELEDMYKSLRLSDEDLLDRAERRDLPTPHQELRNKDLGYFNFDNYNANNNGSRISSPMYYSPSPPFVIGSLESLATTNTSGSENSRLIQQRQQRVRAPPMRRSACPDLVNDDMAKRKYDSTKETKPNDSREQISQSGSYLVISPAFTSPPVSPIPSATSENNYYYPYHHQSTNLHHNDPDLTTDDVTVRNYKKANAIKIIAEPQPLFGIPLGPITKAPNSDYLHSTPTEKFRPLYRHVKNPDIVKDDQAFRNLRKDLNTENNNLSNRDWTPKLFSPLRNFENVFNYNVNDTSADADLKVKNKKLRAVRSLSANISSSSSSPTPYAYPLRAPLNSYSLLNKEIGSSNDANKNKFSRSLTPSTAANNSANNGGSGRTLSNGNYMEPSWVQQIELDYDELRELKRSLSPNRLIPLIRSRHVNPVMTSKVIKDPHQVLSRSSSSPSSDSKNQPRRPWTDIIMESFEREKEAAELERQKQEAYETMRMQQELLGNGNYHHNGPAEDDEDEVFEDASCQTPRDSPIVQGEDCPQPNIRTYKQSHTLLNGQKNRRGSWVGGETQNRNDASIFPSTSCPDDRKCGEFLMKRKSWSDFPKHQQSQSQNEPTSDSTNRLQLNYNPIPPPRRVKQINLEGFHSSTPAAKNQDHDDDEDKLIKASTEADRVSSHCTSQPTVKSVTPFSITVPIPVTTPPTKGEQELEDLMDALLREADTCGPRPPKESENTKDLDQIHTDANGKRKRKIEIKARYPIDDDEDFVDFGRRSSRNSAVAGPSTPESSEATAFTSTFESKGDDAISKLIDSINENLVPSLEQSIKDSMTRMSSMGTTATAEEFTDREKPRPAEVSKETLNLEVLPSSDRPTPLPRHSVPKSADKGPIPNASNNSKTEDQSSSCSKSSSSKFSDPSSELQKKNEGKEKSCITTGLLTRNLEGHKPVRESSIMKVPVESNSEGPSESWSKSKISLKSKCPSDPTKTPPNQVSAQRNAPTNVFKDFLLKPSVSVNPVVRRSSKKDAAESSSYKRDSLSDAEGMSALKKLLRKENSLNIPEGLVPIGGIKKSPSVGSTPTAAASWTKQPAFLNKYFSKPDTSTASNSEPHHPHEGQSINQGQELRTADDKNDNNVLALNVAQKANLFMKLEHEQRFSKWRKNSLDVEPHGGPSGRTSSNSNRFSTQPVTTEEISKAKFVNQNQNYVTSERKKVGMEAHVQYFPRISSVKPVDNSNSQHVGRTLSKNDDDDKKPTILSPTRNAVVRVEPSCLSIKDRVYLFNRMSTIPATTVNHNTVAPTPTDIVGIRTPSMRPSSNVYFRSSMKHSSNSGLDSSGDNLNYLTSPKLFRRRSSISDATTGQSIPVSAPFVNPRSSKVKSLCLAHSWEPEYASEDGEVSSGGQEVSEIISKSYDNSPMFRKKTWKSQIPQPSLSKEIWRKFESRNPSKNINVNDTEWMVKSERESDLSGVTKIPKESLGKIAPSSSSNLLSILRVLSSSDDQLEEDRLPAPKMSHPAKSSKRKYLKMRSEVCVRVPHPDDESFQNFFKKEGEGIYDNVVPMDSTTTPTANNDDSELINAAQGQSSFSLTQNQLSSIKREGDLLIMKKHMPLLRRKSSGKSSKNPLKALAARMDFHNQEYSKTN